MSGFILIDKPAGITSHDVIDRLRRITGIRRIGHAGTLDPFATGLLIVGIGREAPRELGALLGLDKTYQAVGVLGAVSDTQDVTGTITPGKDPKFPDRERLEDVMSSFVGETDQTPPMYSAKKIKGQKLYELARAGREVPREPVRVTIREIDLLSYTPPEFSFVVTCSSGTYIRTLAHDIGEKLGTGAYLKELRRTRIGQHDIAGSHELGSLKPKNWQEAVIGTDAFLGRTD